MTESQDILFVDATALEPGTDGPSKRVVTLPLSWLVGYGAIDQEHQLLLNIINEGWRVSAGSGMAGLRRVLDVLASLHASMREHFEHEEAEMTRLGYPGVREHAARHVAALAHLSRVEVGLNEIGGVDRQALYEMLSVLIDDILRADIPFKTFLQQSGRVR